MSDQDFAHVMEEQDINNARQKEESEIKPIDINSLKPSGEIIRMQFGEKMEILSTTSADIADNIINNILDGYMDVKDFLVKKRLIVDALEIVSKNDKVKKYAIEEVERLKGERVMGAKISLTERATYDYEKDPTCKKLMDEIKPLADQLKAQQDLVKIACKTNSSLIDEDGQIKAMVVPAPATTSISVSFSKK